MIALLDTSALVKLVVHENRTSELQSWLAGDVVPAASALVRVELRRAAQRLDVQMQPFVEQVLARLHLLRLDDVLDLAGALASATLRSLDALHVATAVRSGVDVLVSYDQRMVDGARGAGVRTLTRDRPCSSGRSAVSAPGRARTRDGYACGTTGPKQDTQVSSRRPLQSSSALVRSRLYTQ